MTNERTNLNVPYEEKDIAKSYGAKWDKNRKTWYVLGDTKKFLRWVDVLEDGSMTLDQYLRLRHSSVLAITKAEAKLIGIQYPLKNGWIDRHGGMVLSREQVNELKNARENRYNSDKYQKAKNKIKAKGAKAIAKAIDWSTPHAFIQN